MPHLQTHRALPLSLVLPGHQVRKLYEVNVTGQGWCSWENSSETELEHPTLILDASQHELQLEMLCWSTGQVLDQGEQRLHVDCWETAICYTVCYTWYISPSMWLKNLKQDLKSRGAGLLVANMIRQTKNRWITEPTASLNSQMDEAWHSLSMQFLRFSLRRSNWVRWLGRLRMCYSRAKKPFKIHFKLLATKGKQSHVPLKLEIETPRPDAESALKLIDLGSLTPVEFSVHLVCLGHFGVSPIKDFPLERLDVNPGYMYISLYIMTCFVFVF